MMMFSSTEAVTTAKATTVVANLTHMKKGIIAWYTDNRKRIRIDTKNNTFYFDDIAYHSIQDVLVGKTNTNFDIKDVRYDNGASMNSYIDGLDAANAKGDNTRGTWDYLSNSGYGVNDAGEYGRRTTWFVGYKFAEGDDTTLKRKLWNRSKSLGWVFFRGNRPNPEGMLPVTNEGDISEAKSVWLLAFGKYVPDGKEKGKIK